MLEKFSRRGAIAVVIAALCALAISACGSASGNTTTPQFPTGKGIPKGPVHLTMWWWGEQEAKGAGKWLAQSIQDYRKLHPNVTFTTVLQTTDGLIPTFQTAAAAGKGPDIEFFWGGIYSMEPTWHNWIRPISEYLPASETNHYLNAKEDTYQGKVMTAPWYVQPSFPLLYRKDVLQKAGVQPPTDWSSLLAACDALRSKGITPISGGLKDGFFAGWLFSMLGGQNIQLSQLINAVTGKEKFTDPGLAAWWGRLQQLRDHKCFNSDINSLQLYQGQQRWSNGQAAMTITAGSDVRKFITSVGVSKVGLMAMPPLSGGSGHLGSTSQTLGITKTSRYPQVAADFIRFLHTPDRLNAFYAATGAIPADDRFNGSMINLPQQHLIYAQVKTFTPYLENFIPSELDSQAIFTQTQLLMGGNANATKAASATEALARRLQLTQSQETQDFSHWASTFE